MGLKTFSERAIRLDNRPFSLAKRPYLHNVYRSRAKNIVIRASRQVEKSTFLVNTILYAAVTRPGTQILFVCPRRDQARLFSHNRLGATVLNSPSLRKFLWPYGRPIPIEDIPFANGSHVYIRAAFHSADAIRGISADMLLVDEYQDLAAGQLPVLRETLSHADDPRTVLTGTPKMIDNHLEVAFNDSTACEWTVACSTCSQRRILNEQVFGTAGLVCPACQNPLDPRQGHWVPKNPRSAWGDGFWINHLMVPWMNTQEILIRQRDYDPVLFLNEVMGLPTNLGDHIITREEIEACCEDRPFAQGIADVSVGARAELVAGIDWGGGSRSGTVLVLGYALSNLTFQVVRLDRWVPHEHPSKVLDEVAQLCRRFRVPWIAADGGGNGQIYNRLLLDRLHSQNRQVSLYAIYYSAADQPPVRDGALTKWTVNRSGSIGTLFARIKKRLLRFPRASDCSTFLDEFICEFGVYDEEMKTVRYTKPETLRDDALHATNYAELLALRRVHSMQG